MCPSAISVRNDQEGTDLWEISGKSMSCCLQRCLGLGAWAPCRVRGLSGVFEPRRHDASGTARRRRRGAEALQPSAGVPLREMVFQEPVPGSMFAFGGGGQLVIWIGFGFGFEPLVLVSRWETRWNTSKPTQTWRKAETRALLPFNLFWEARAPFTPQIKMEPQKP